MEPGTGLAQVPMARAGPTEVSLSQRPPSPNPQGAVGWWGWWGKQQGWCCGSSLQHEDARPLFTLTRLWSSIAPTPSRSAARTRQQLSCQKPSSC